MTAPAVSPYVRVYQPKPSGIIGSPGMLDLPYIAPAGSAALLTRAVLTSTWSVTPPDSFVLGTTMPVLDDPLNPTGTDNVGWTGDTSGGVFVGAVHTVPAGTRRKGCVFLCDVQLTDSTSILDDCIIFGGVGYNGSRPGLVTASNGGQMVRCTIWGLATSVAYYRNGVNFQGNFTAERCALFRCVDALRTTTGTLTLLGSLFDRFAFFDNDQDHPSGTVTSPPLWTHNDAFQITSVSPNQHRIIGNLFMQRCDITGVTWSGTPGSSTASNGAVPTSHPTTRPTVATPIGMPATQLNPQTISAGTTSRYITPWLYGVYCNGLMFNNTGHKALITDNWFEGGNDPSSLVHLVTGTANQIILLRNRFGVGGFRTLSTRKFLGSWSSSTPASQIDTGTGGDVNVFGDFQSCRDTLTLSGVSKPAGIVGEPVVVTSGGVRYAA